MPASAAGVVDPVRELSRPRVDPNGPIFEPIAGPDVRVESSFIPATRDAGSPLPSTEGKAPVTFGTGAWRDTTDIKQKARWLLAVAREQIRKKHFDIAEQAIAEAKALNVQWTLFDETPEKLSEFLAVARTKAGNSDRSERPSRSEAPRDRKTAKVRLREARAALAANDLEGAEAIVREVRGWGISYGLFDDTPDKVSAAIFEDRRREAMRNADLMVRSYYRNAPKPQPERAGGELESPKEVQPD